MLQQACARHARCERKAESSPNQTTPALTVGCSHHFGELQGTKFNGIEEPGMRLTPRDGQSDGSQQKGPTPGTLAALLLTPALPPSAKAC